MSRLFDIFCVLSADECGSAENEHRHHCVISCLKASHASISLFRSLSAWHSAVSAANLTTILSLFDRFEQTAKVCCCASVFLGWSLTTIWFKPDGSMQGGLFINRFFFQNLTGQPSDRPMHVCYIPLFRHIQNWGQQVKGLLTDSLSTTLTSHTGQNLCVCVCVCVCGLQLCLQIT